MEHRAVKKDEEITDRVFLIIALALGIAAIVSFLIVLASLAR